MRRSIMLLETAKTITPDGTALTSATIERVAGVLPDVVITNIITACSSNSFDKLENCVNDIYAQGYSCNCIVEGLVQWMGTNINGDTINTLTDIQKAAFARQCAQVDYAMSFGSNEYLQLFSLLSHLMKLLC